MKKEKYKKGWELIKSLFGAIYYPSTLTVFNEL